MSTLPTAGQDKAVLWVELYRLLKWFRWILLATAALFVLLLAAEAARLHALAAGVHPVLGYAALGAMILAAALVAVPVWRFLRVPRVVEPPPIPEPEALGLRHLRAEVDYLDRYLANCLRNVEFLGRQDEIRSARAELAAYRRKLAGTADSRAYEIEQELGRWSGETFGRLLADVDRKAERLIYEEAVNVGVGTAVSPNGTLDAFVMLWRSVNLVSRLAVLYYGRPGLWGTLAICRDVSIATALAGHLQNVTDSLGNVLARSLGGFTGMIAGPAVEGVTNALVLVRIGYLAKERCRSYRKWDRRMQRFALLNALHATQKVAIGLTGEILRKASSGAAAVAGAAATGVFNVASGIGQKITSFLRGGRETPPGKG